MTADRPGSRSDVEHHPRHALDDVLQSPVRLSVVAALSGVERADFTTLRDTIELSDSALSKQLTALEDAGYVEITKDRVARRARTRVRLTDAGTAALRSHLAALRAIAELSLPAAAD